LGRLLLLRGRTGPARRALRRARAAWEVIVSQAPELYRERMSDEPEARALSESWDALLEEGDEPAEASSSSSSQASLLLDPDRLRRLLAINKRLNSELRLPRLLELIMDTVIELTGADRGFLLLVEEEGKLSIKVARNIDQRSLEGEELSLSRSIAERATSSGLPVVTVDAAADGRFQEALSVSDLHLRSVLAIPLRVKGSTVGTIYVDSRLRQGLFGEAEVRLVGDLADQAAIAIDNARLHAENRRRQREIERLNQRLRRKVQSQQAELDEVREELRSSREALQPGKGHHGIIGRSARMRELFHLLDRVVETELPVVVEGESGTGKELVARAVHQHGRRRERPFVSENCAAIPESLLESILFGHVRGAYTGADRDRKGLFEVASGGTLFLDEVGEMSAAMQTKLLRVLQDGEFRRVGGTQALHADVRIIAASNKDLAQLVAAGRFREDLFYRLNVIRVVVPPLRERREDIPLLVEHFLDKHGLAEGRRISSEAMALLCGHAWPGNVRELENEVLRSAALAGKEIRPRDLSPHIAGGVPLSVTQGDEVNLKVRVEHLERELLRRVLGEASGNHTQAALRLGLSRFGLLKKLRRYGMGERE
jgi:transcriptional regulator with GAF, ATPase, and Fis domain